MTKMYLVIVASGYYEDYHEKFVFITNSEHKAARWCDKFNRIISENKERMHKFYGDEDDKKDPPFWFHVIDDDPNAFYRDVEYREELTDIKR